jgi:DNA polymerase-3 subunit epsilon
MNDFITIDFETAVQSPESAISIGLVKYRNYQPISTYYSLIRPPELYIRPDFTDIHDLSVSDVKDAPDFNHR